MIDFLNSQAGAALIAAIIGAIWTLFKSSDWWEKLQSSRYARAVNCLEGGVLVTYQTYVDALKKANEDGTITPEEEVTARRRAFTAAFDFGKSMGIDIVAILGEDAVDLWIERIIAQRKGAAK